MLKHKRKARKGLVSEINVVPYIDVMLVLLVIFMITAPILSQGITVDLPKVAGEAVESKNNEPIIVSVTEQGDYFLNIDDNPDAPINEHDLVLKVAATLSLVKEKHEEIAVLVKGDKGVFYGKVANLMGLLREAGAIKVGLVTDSYEDEKHG
jgi:biopolymer transport protein TolR